MAVKARGPTFDAIQAAGPPPGSVEVRTSPAPSTATHSEGLGHATPKREFEPSTLVTVQAAGPPVGSVEVTTLPEPSTATHSEAPGQATRRSRLEPSTWLTVQD